MKLKKDWPKETVTLKRDGSKLPRLSERRAMKIVLKEAGKKPWKKARRVVVFEREGA